MCGSDEPHPYSVRSFTYHNEQTRANEVQWMIVYTVLSYCECWTEEKYY